MSASPPPAVAAYLAGVNSFDVDAILATFAEDAYVNDARREINGIDAIRRWVETEMVGDHVTMEPLEVIDHHGDTIVRSRYDGTQDQPSRRADHVGLLQCPRRQHRQPRRDPQPALPILMGTPAPAALPTETKQTHI